MVSSNELQGFFKSLRITSAAEQSLLINFGGLLMPFDITKLSAAAQARPASRSQCHALGGRLAKKVKGKMSYVDKSRVGAHLAKRASDGSFSIADANGYFKLKSLPKADRAAITAYCKENDLAV